MFLYTTGILNHSYKTLARGASWRVLVRIFIKTVAALTITPANYIFNTIPRLEGEAVKDSDTIYLPN